MDMKEGIDVMGLVWLAPVVVGQFDNYVNRYLETVSENIRKDVIKSNVDDYKCFVQDDKSLWVQLYIGDGKTINLLVQEYLWGWRDQERH